MNDLHESVALFRLLKEWRRLLPLSKTVKLQGATESTIKHKLDPRIDELFKMLRTLSREITPAFDSKEAALAHLVDYVYARLTDRLK